MLRLKQIATLSLCFCFVLPALAWTNVTVKSGQTLSGIITKYSPDGVSASEMTKALKAQNPRLAKYGLQSGMKLRVPTTTADIRDSLSGGVSSSATQSSPVQKRSTNNTQSVSSTSKQLADCQTTIANLQQALNNQNQTLQTYQAKMGDLTERLNGESSGKVGPAVKSSSVLSFADLWFFLWLITFILLWRVHLKYRNLLGQRPRTNFSRSTEAVTPKQEPGIYAKQEPQIEADTLKNMSEPTLEDFVETDSRQVELDIPAAGAPAQTQMPFTPSLSQEESHEWAGEQQNIIDAIASDHDNIEWHMALLEFYIKTRNEAAYQRHIETMLRTGLMSEGDALWEKVRKMYLNTWVYHEGTG